MSEQKIGRNCPIRNVTTGKVYRNVHYACMDLGIRPKTLYKYMSMGQSINGHRFERVEMQDRLQARKQALNPDLFMQLNMVKFPPSLQIGDYVAIKDDRVLIYGNLSSVESRSMISGENICRLAEKAQKDEYGRIWIYVSDDFVRNKLMGGDLEQVSEIRAKEVSKIKMGVAK